MRPTRAEIHLRHLRHNIEYVKQRVGRAGIMAIVKANAYGHGLELVAREAERTRLINSFGVATEEEGCRLRACTSLPILVLTTPLPNEIDTFIQYDLAFTLVNREMIRLISARAAALGKQAKAHMKIDTGMRRIGVEPEEAVPFVEAVLADPHISLEGISTHFATSDEIASQFFEKQLEVFESTLRAITAAGFNLPTIHAANSGAILQHPQRTAFDMVRPGIMLYGYTPSHELDALYGGDLLPPLELVSHNAFSKRVKAGEGVSYNLRWHAVEETNIITAPMGYGDGYPRSLTNRSSAIIRGKMYPVVGTICMDQVLINVGHDEIPAGERITFISPTPHKLNAWTLAETIGTIPYEILTGIAARVPRVEVD